MPIIRKVDGKFVLVPFPTLFGKTTATLQKHCAMTLLKSSVHQMNGDVFNEKKARCACDYYELNYMNDYKTKEFIWLLPLPVTVKEYLFEVAKKNCDDHPRPKDSDEEQEQECEDYCDGGCEVCCPEDFSVSSLEEDDSHSYECECDDCLSEKKSWLDEEEEKEESSSEETDGQSDMKEGKTNPDQDQSERESEPEEEKRSSEQESDLEEDLRHSDQDGASNTLQELCARAILKLRLQQWPGPSGAVINGWSVSRCLCYKCAQGFIARLPLPDNVQKFVEKVALHLKKRRKGVKMNSEQDRAADGKTFKDLCPKDKAMLRLELEKDWASEEENEEKV